MSSTLDISEDPLSEEELAAVRQNAKEQIGLWKKRSIYSGIAFFLSCAL